LLPELGTTTPSTSAYRRIQARSESLASFDDEHRLVREWAELHLDELAMNWDLAQALEPLVEIDPLP
jgi:hypothetical protein